MKKLLLVLIAFSLISPSAYAVCYDANILVQVTPGTSASSTNPNATTGRIEGFIDPLTGIKQDATVIVTPKWVPCMTDTGLGNSNSWRPASAQTLGFPWYSMTAWDDADVAATVAFIEDPTQPLRPSYIFPMDLKVPPMPGDATRAPWMNNLKIPKKIVVYFVESVARQVGTSF